MTEPFIAAARTAVPDLLDERTALLAENKTLREEVGQLQKATTASLSILRAPRDQEDQDADYLIEMQERRALAAEAEVERLREALSTLVDRLDKVHEDPQYKSV